MLVACNQRRSRLCSTVLALACVSLLSVTPHAARAQSLNTPPNAQAVEQATRLFDEAGARMAEKRFAEACSLYEQSQALDPQLGTLLHLADCQEQLGKTASAYRNYQTARALAAARATSGKPEPREAVAARRADRLQPQLAKLRVSFTAAHDGSRVLLDGQLVLAEELGVFQPIDPGQHTVRVEADGHQPWSQTVAIEPATRHDIHVPRLQPTAAELTVASSPPVVESAVSGSSYTQPSKASNYQRVAGYIVGGAGVVGLGLASYFGLRSLHYLSERDKLCPDGSCALAPPAADDVVRADERARDFSVAFNWTAALSAVGVGAGLALVLTAPRERQVELSMGWGSLQLRGQLPE
jgi:hypothetical protein